MRMRPRVGRTAAPVRVGRRCENRWTVGSFSRLLLIKSLKRDCLGLLVALLGALGAAGGLIGAERRPTGEVLLTPCNILGAASRRNTRRRSGNAEQTRKRSAARHSRAAGAPASAAGLGRLLLMAAMTGVAAHATARRACTACSSSRMRARAACEALVAPGPPSPPLSSLFAAGPCPCSAASWSRARSPVTSRSCGGSRSDACGVALKSANGFLHFSHMIQKQFLLNTSDCATPRATKTLKGGDHTATSGRSQLALHSSVRLWTEFPCSGGAQPNVALT